MERLIFDLFIYKDKFRVLLGIDRRGGPFLNGAKNGKGCDIGYALAASSCEEAPSVDACTVTALDVTTAFAVPDPGLLLAEFAGFFGSGYSADCSTKPRSLSLLRISHCLV